MKTLPNLLWALLLIAAGAGLTGCSSLDKSGAGAFASVQISGHTREQVRGAVLLEFEQDGYAPADMKRDEMVFEKEGTRWDEVAYGGWLDKNIWVRVSVSLVPLSDGAYRLQCQAFKVRDKGAPTQEDPVPLRKNKNKPYQAVLDKVAARLAR
jgi:hypothetical protein